MEYKSNTPESVHQCGARGIFLDAATVDCVTSRQADACIEASHVGDVVVSSTAGMQIGEMATDCDFRTVVLNNPTAIVSASNRTPTCAPLKDACSPAFCLPSDYVHVACIMPEGLRWLHETEGQKTFEDVVLAYEDILGKAIQHFRAAVLCYDSTDGFCICAFHNAVDAVDFAVSLNEDLTRYKWDVRVLKYEGFTFVAPTGTPIFCGPRLRCGIHSGITRGLDLLQRGNVCV